MIKSMKMSRIISITVIYAIFVIISIITLFPIVYTIVSSFKSNMEIMAYPDRFWVEKPTFDNYIQAWNSDNFQVGRMFFNSMWFTVLSVIISLFISTVSGYVYERGNFKLKKPLYALFLSLMFISLGSITIYPKFEILSHLRLNKSLFGLLFMNCFAMPIVHVVLVRSFIATLPKELDESALIDGCSFTGIFFKIILPLLKPIVATLGVLSFQSSWNNYLMPTLFTMSNPKQQTLIVGIVALKNSGEGASSWNLMFAGTVIALLPVLIVYAIGNKYFTDGITAGAVKG